MNQIPNAFVFDSLEFVCDLVFGAWNFPCSSTQIYLKIFIIYVGHYNFCSFACASLYSIPCRFKIS